MEVTKDYILQRIEQSELGCWLWTKQLQTHGYSFIPLKTEDRVYGTQLGHRISFILFRGPIKKGYVLDHLCQVKRCVNPDHLEVVTQAENNRRRDIALGKDMENFPCGHSRTGDHVYRRRQGVRKNGNVIYLDVCRPCYLEYARNYNKKYKEAKRAATDRIH